MVRNIKELGDSQRCSKCNEFGKMSGVRVSPNVVKALYTCEKCVKNFTQDYDIQEFVNMGNSFLLDEEWIKDFQKKYMIANGEFVEIRDGIDGSKFLEGRTAVQDHGKKLICKCGKFYRMGYIGHKKKDVQLALVCNKCGKKKLKMAKDDFFKMGDAGLIPDHIFKIVKEDIDLDEMEWDSGEAYGIPSSVLSTDARSRLGMDDDETLDELEGLVCSKCGAAINIEMKKFGKCPTCGQALTL